MIQTHFTFKSKDAFYHREKLGFKPNTVRKIDLMDDRFLDLIYHAHKGFDSKLKIKIINTDTEASFEREIIDITIWDNLMIISWIHERQESVGGWRDKGKESVGKRGDKTKIDIKTTQEIYNGAIVNWDIVQNDGSERWIKVGDIINLIDEDIKFQESDLRSDFQQDKPIKWRIEGMQLLKSKIDEKTWDVGK